MACIVVEASVQKITIFYVTYLVRKLISLWSFTLWNSKEKLIVFVASCSQALFCKVPREITQLPKRKEDRKILKLI